VPSVIATKCSTPPPSQAKITDPSSPVRQRVIALNTFRCCREITAHELVYEYRDWFVISYSPNEQGYAGVIAIRVNADGVKLYLSGGKELSDPEKLLQGSGKQMRWMHLQSASAFARPDVASLIDKAIALSSVPFASVGRGPVAICSASGK
jgi:hypothetical protein